MTSWHHCWEKPLSWEQRGENIMLDGGQDMGASDGSHSFHSWGSEKSISTILLFRGERIQMFFAQRHQTNLCYPIFFGNPIIICRVMQEFRFLVLNLFYLCSHMVLSSLRWHLCGCGFSPAFEWQWGKQGYHGLKYTYFHALLPGIPSQNYLCTWVTRPSECCVPKQKVHVTDQWIYR